MLYVNYVPLFKQADERQNKTARFDVDKIINKITLNKVLNNISHITQT